MGCREKKGTGLTAGRVVHVLRHPYDVYIGRSMPRFGLRASPFANPFKIGRDGTRAEVIEKYRRYIVTRTDLMDALPELEGKTLACWCVPEPCHGNVILQLLNNL